MIWFGVISMMVIAWYIIPVVGTKAGLENGLIASIVFLYWIICIALGIYGTVLDHLHRNSCYYDRNYYDRKEGKGVKK